MVNILFVCLGNICRSPMAEAIFRKKVSESGLNDQIHIESAGTGHWHIGSPPHDGTLKILAENNIESSGMKARQVEKDDLIRFDIVVAMDAENLGHLHTLQKPDQKADVVRLLDFVEGADENDVPDPFFTGNFDEVYAMIDTACDLLLQEVKEEWL